MNLRDIDPDIDRILDDLDSSRDAFAAFTQSGADTFPNIVSLTAIIAHTVAHDYSHDAAEHFMTGVGLALSLVAQANAIPECLVNIDADSERPA